MREVRAVISRQWAVVNGRDRASVDRGPLNQVVEKEYKQHCEEALETAWKLSDGVVIMT